MVLLLREAPPERRLESIGRIAGNETCPAHERPDGVPALTDSSHFEDEGCVERLQHVREEQQGPQEEDHTS